MNRNFRQKRVFLASVLCAMLFGVHAPAFAQTYPDRPIRLIVGLAAGGGGDIAARSIGEYLSSRLGQPVVVENKVGAVTAIATDAVAKAKPDGYTLLLIAGDTAAIDKGFATPLPYDVQKDLTLISGVANIPLVLVASPKSGIQSLSDLVEKAKASPGKLNFASQGTSSPHFLFFEWFKKNARIDLTDIPYKSTAQATSDVVGGQVDLTMIGEISAASQVKAGRVIPVATTSMKRLDSFPQMPSFQEAYPGLVMENWYALAGPAGLPPAIVAKLNSIVLDGLALPATAQRLSTIGLRPWVMPSSQLNDYMRSQITHYGEIIRVSGAKPEAR